MLISANMIRIHSVYGIKSTFDALAKAGFEGIDFNNDVHPYYTEEYDESFYRDLRNHADEVGVKICQAHAPFPSSYAEEDKTEQRFFEIVQAIKNASYLGAPMIVVHPCTHFAIEDGESEERMFEYNLNFYRRLIPYAEEAGIKIAIENINRASITSTPERLNRLFDTLDNPVFTICFDVGHCLFQGVAPDEAIRKIGQRMVYGCTHVHDNTGDKDTHTLPFYGNVEWESVMKALADIGYEGDLNYEASAFIAKLPGDLYPLGLEYMANVGKYLIGRFDYYKKGLILNGKI